MKMKTFLRKYWVVLLVAAVLITVAILALTGVIFPAEKHSWAS